MSSTTLLDPSSTIQAAGLKDGDEVSVVTAPKSLGRSSACVCLDFLHGALVCFTRV